MWTTESIARGARRSPARAFTLVEVAVATAVIGIGVVALLTAVGAGTKVNDAGKKLTQAVFLGQEIREWTLRMNFDTLAALGTVTYTPPRDGQGVAIADMSNWSEQIKVSYLNASNLALTSASATDVLQVQLSISCGGSPILSTSWIVARRSTGL